jgi:hypothetical protein
MVCFSTFSLGIILFPRRKIATPDSGIHGEAQEGTIQLHENLLDHLEKSGIMIKIRLRLEQMLQLHPNWRIILAKRRDDRKEFTISVILV